MTDRRLTQKGMGVCQVATSPNGVSAGVPPVTVAMGEGTIRSIYPSSSSSSLTPFSFSLLHLSHPPPLALYILFFVHSILRLLSSLRRPQLLYILGLVYRMIRSACPVAI